MAAEADWRSMGVLRLSYMTLHRIAAILDTPAVNNWKTILAMMPEYGLVITNDPVIKIISPSIMQSAGTASLRAMWPESIISFVPGDGKSRQDTRRPVSLC